MEHDSFVTYRLSGRLGNQLQLWACARTLSLRYGLQLAPAPLPAAAGLRLAERLPRSRWQGALRHALRPRVRLYDHAWDLSFNEDGSLREELAARKGVLFVLNWGGIFKRVDRFRPQLLEELLGDHAAAVPAIADRAQVGVHIRRDDGQYPLPISYYVEALARIRAEVGEPVVHVFSDGDARALGEELAGQARLRDWRPRPRGSAVGDLLALAAFPTLVGSMSWFSYWAAYLSHDAIVYVPDAFRYYPHWRGIVVPGIAP